MPKLKESKIPIGIKIISILYIIFAIVEFIIAVFLIFGASLFDLILKDIADLLGSRFLVLIGVLLLGIGFLTFFSGLGLWKRQKWARIAIIIFSVLGLLRSLLSIVKGDYYSAIVGLIINSVIGGYLIFNKKVKSAFS